MKKTDSMGYYFLIAAIIAATDQSFKMAITGSMNVGEKVMVIPNFMYIRLVHNTGAAFSFMQDRPGLVLGLVAAAICIIVAVMILKRNSMTNVLMIFLSLVLGGAIGNFIDRVRLGYVVDYVDIRIIPVFNFADIFVTVGVLLLSLYFVFYNNYKRAEEQSGKGASSSQNHGQGNRHKKNRKRRK